MSTTAKKQQRPEGDAYAEMQKENAQLRQQLKALEKAQKKKRKRPANAYQQAWGKMYKEEVLHAKSDYATKPKESWLLPYSRQYGPTLNTAPAPKSGEPLEKPDKSVFMKNVGARAKRAAAEQKVELDPPPSPRGVDELNS